MVVVGVVVVVEGAAAKERRGHREQWIDKQITDF